METKFDVGEKVRFEGKIDKIVTEQCSMKTVTLYYLEGLSEAFTESNLTKVMGPSESNSIERAIHELATKLKQAMAANSEEVTP